MEPTLLSSHASLVFAMGMVAYIGLIHLWFWRRSDPAHLWVVLWCGLTLAFQLARHRHLHTADPATAVAASRVLAGLGVPLIWSVVGFARSLTPRPLSTAQALATGAGSAALALLAASTPWFIPGEVDFRHDWFGRPYLGAPGGPPMMVLLLAIGVGLVYAIRQIRRHSAIGAAERRVLVASLGGYAGLGFFSVLSAMRVIPQPALVEYGPLVVAVGLNYLLVHRHSRLQTRLEQMVAERTAEIRAAHEQLAGSEARYRGLVENAPVGVFACDRDGRLTAVNPKLKSIVGSPEPSLVPLSVFEHPPLIASGVTDRVRRCLETGETASSEHVYTSGYGRTAEVRLTVSALRDAQGRDIGVLGVVEDVGERKALERRLRQAQKMESVGQLAAGIAHEINNPMAYVRTNLSVLRGEWQALREALDASLPKGVPRARLADWKELIDDALEGVERTVAIVRDVKEFSHAGGEERVPSDLNAIVESSVRVASTHRRGAARIEEDYGALPPVRCAPGPLRQVFVNLVVNALQALGEGGTVRVGTRREDGEAVVTVEDDGTGIAPEILERLFDPFFTTKAAGEGTGLGLYVSYQIVRLHAGEIRVQSSVGRGSRFEVRLPVAGEGGTGAV